MATDNYVVVGHVFQVFPGKFDPYIGIAVANHGFCPQDELILRNGDRETTVKVSSIEIERKRVNVAKEGDKCAIKTAHSIPEDFPLDTYTTVLAKKTCVDKAVGKTQEMSPRPPKFADIRRQESHRRSFVD